MFVNKITKMLLSAEFTFFHQLGYCEEKIRNQFSATWFVIFYKSTVKQSQRTLTVA